MLLQGKTALVIDGNQGINQTIARHLSRSGASVIITDKTPVTDQVDLTFPYIQVDFSRQLVMNHCYEALSNLKIDIVIIQPETLHIHTTHKRNSPLSIKKAMNHFKKLINLLIDKMRHQQFGRFVTVMHHDSIDALPEHIINPNQHNWGNLYFLLEKASELVEKNILINGITTHLLATTELKSKLSIEESEAILKETVMGRFALPDDIAKCVTWLASADNSFLSGEQLILNGGYGRIL